MKNITNFEPILILLASIQETRKESLLNLEEYGAQGISMTVMLIKIVCIYSVLNVHQHCTKHYTATNPLILPSISISMFTDYATEAKIG